MARCASRSPTAIASSPRWSKRSPARSNRWGCTSPRWRMCFCGRPERHYGSVFIGGGNTVAAGADPLLAPEEPRARRGGLSLDFLGGDRIRLRRRRTEILLPRYRSADGDVFGDLLHHVDHRGSPRG